MILRSLPFFSGGCSHPYRWRSVQIVGVTLLLLLTFTGSLYAQEEPVDPISDADPWIAGETSVSKLSIQQQRYLLGVPPDTEELELGLVSAPSIGVYDYPPTVDWRRVSDFWSTTNWTTPIRNQSSCGSCVAFGTTGAIESRLEIVYDNPRLNPDLSDANLFYCGCGSCCGRGWYPSAAMSYAVNYGIVDEACFPYQPFDQACTLCPDWPERTNRLLRWYGTSNVDEMKQALTNGGPIEATFSVYSDFFSYTNGIYRHRSGGYVGGHAVTIVGYNDEKGYWIGKNSWGTDWGKKGWFKIAYGEVGIDSYMYVPVVAPKATLLLSPAKGFKLDGSWFADEDIIAYDLQQRQWTKLFDGSDVGVRSNDVDAFALLDDGTFVMSFINPQSLPDIGNVDDSDIVRFVPTSLGNRTTGTFEMFFDGSDVGLTKDAEDIDAISWSPGGALIVSTVGNFRVLESDQQVLKGADEDLLRFEIESTGKVTKGTWELYFDGSYVGLDTPSEDINGLWIGEKNGIYLTTNGEFSLPYLPMGDAADIFICRGGMTVEVTYCSYRSFWSGAELGYPATARIDGLHVAQQLPTAVQSAITASAAEEIDLNDMIDDIDTWVEAVDEEENDLYQIHLPIILQ